VSEFLRLISVPLRHARRIHRVFAHLILGADTFVPLWHSFVPTSSGRHGMEREAKGAVIHAPFGAESI